MEKKMTKFIDLASIITDEIGGYQTEHAVTLNWLDRLAAEHPDQVPGRTITESELSGLYDSAQSSASEFRNALFDLGLGITVVPDPEPTNAEMLKAVLDAIGDSTAGYREHLASKLDEAGVKAPGGDDDH